MQKDWINFLNHHPHQEKDFPQVNTSMLFDLSANGLLKVSGIDAKKLLQGQLTCNVEEITTGKPLLGAHCTPQGRVISLFQLFINEAAYYLLMPRTMIATALAALKKFAVFYKVELSDASDELVILGYAGPPVASIQHAPIALEISSLSFPRWIMLGESTVMQKVWLEFAEKSGIGSMNNWKSLAIQDGIPTIYPETTGKFLPHEINLPTLNAISFNKGCYTGQEIIARMHYRGKLKTHMYCVTMIHDRIPLPGSNVYCYQAETLQPAGVVVDACYEEYNKIRALIVINEENAKNNHLFLEPENIVFFTLMA